MEPNLASSPEDAVNQTFQDLLRYNPSEQQLNLAVSEEMNTGGYLFENTAYLSWVSELSEREIFQNMVDSIAGYHIMTGQWPDNIKINEIMDTYSAVPNNGTDGSLDGDGD